MKQQSIGILLCALVLTTLGHEILNRHYAHAASRQEYLGAARHKNLPAAKSHLAARDNACPITCTVLPNADLSGNLTIVINVELGLIAIQNATANIVIIIDIRAGLVAVSNSTSGETLVIDLSTGVGIVVSAGYTGDKNLTLYLQEIKTLSFYYSLSVGVVVVVAANVSVEIQILIQTALLVTSGGQYNVSLAQAYAALIEIAVSLRADLQVVIQVIASVVISVGITLERLIEIIKGLAGAIALIKGGITAAVAAGLRLSLAVVLTAESTVAIITYFIGAIIAAKLTILADTLSILLLLANLAGNAIAGGVGGILTFIARIAAVISGSISIELFIEFLFEFFSAVKVTISLAEFYAQIDILIAYVKTLQVTAELQAVLTLLISIRNGALIIGGINVSKIIQLFVGVAGFVILNVIVLILLDLSIKFAIATLISKLVIGLIQLLLVQGGASIVLILIPGIQISANLAAEIIAKLRSTTLVKALLDPIGFLKGLAAVWVVINAVLAAVVAVNFTILVSVQVAIATAVIKWLFQIYTNGSLSIGISFSGGVSAGGNSSTTTVAAG